VNKKMQDNSGTRRFRLLAGEERLRKRFTDGLIYKADQDLAREPALRRLLAGRDR